MEFFSKPENVPDHRVHIPLSHAAQTFKVDGQPWSSPGSIHGASWSNSLAFGCNGEEDPRRVECNKYLDEAFADMKGAEDVVALLSKALQLARRKAKGDNAAKMAPDMIETMGSLETMGSPEVVREATRSFTKRRSLTVRRTSTATSTTFTGSPFGTRRTSTLSGSGSPFGTRRTSTAASAAVGSFSAGMQIFGSAGAKGSGGKKGGSGGSSPDLDRSDRGRTHKSRRASTVLTPGERSLAFIGAGSFADDTHEAPETPGSADSNCSTRKSTSDVAKSLQEWEANGGGVLEGVLRSGAVAMLDAHWVCELADRGGCIQRRQDLPPEAFVSLERLMSYGLQLGSLPIIAISW